MGEAWEQG